MSKTTTYSLEITVGKEVRNIVIEVINMSRTDFDNAVTNWKYRTDEFTSRSLAEYINSKHHMTGHKAIPHKSIHP